MKISVQPLLPTGSYLNVRIGIEKDFPDDANEMESVFSVWDNIIAIHMKRYPHLYTEKGEPKYEPYNGEEEQRGTHVKDVVGSVQDSINEINKCETMEELKHCWIMSKGNLVLSAAYKVKEKQLNDAK